METATAKKPKTIAELLPDLSGILSKDAIQILTAKKQPRPRTTEAKKPLTIAEMRADIKALRIESPRRFAQSTSTKKKNWNSSVKIDKKVSHTADGQLKNNPVRKVLQFQPPRSKLAPPSSRMTMKPNNIETPKFPKPDVQVKKYLQAHNTVRISGVCNISETPVINKKPTMKRMTISNKENISNLQNGKTFITPKPLSKPQFRKHLVPDTPLSNDSWKSSCDSSFLQKEKEINDVEEKAQAVSEECTIENIAGVSPPVSTPFKEYRNVQDFFNNSSELESSALYNDNTIMCFDKQPKLKENNREESVIVSLCDLLNKAKVSTSEKTSTELEDLLEVERETEYNIKMIENCISTLINMKESQMKSLHFVRKSISEKNNLKISESEQNKTLVTEGITPKTLKKVITHPQNDTQLGKPCSVIKSPLKSPIYKIPKKNMALRKKVFYKSMPNMLTPNKETCSEALNMYMKLKENMNFLNSPVNKHTHATCPDTPAVTSHNLQRQLDKLYAES